MPEERDSPGRDRQDGHGSDQGGLDEPGYEQELKRALTLVSNVALVVAGITPATALLIIAPVALTQAGTGAFWAYILAGVVAVCMALCFAELGSMYPTAGGQYPIVTRVLGKHVGFFAMLDYTVLGVFIPASIALGFGTYLSSLVSWIDPNVASTIVVLGATELATLSISDNAWVVKAIVGLELALLGGLLILGLSSIQQPVGVLFNPVSVSGGDTAAAAGFALIFAAITTGLFSYNGYDQAIVFSERPRESRSR